MLNEICEEITIPKIIPKKLHQNWNKITATKIFFDIDSLSIKYFFVGKKDINIYDYIVSRNVMVCKINKDRSVMS